MFKTVTWNTASAAERWRFNLKLKKNKKSKKPQAPSRKRQASSPAGLSLNTIKK